MSLPLNKKQAYIAIKWLKLNFSKQILAAVDKTPFTIDVICGIACQETAYGWVNWVNKLDPREILSLCVFDASGDYPGTERTVFPRNTETFRKAYGNELTSMLINEANKSRVKRGYKPGNWVYKGYGIFQYDLQFIREDKDKDKDFFIQKQWYSFEECLSRLMGELKSCWKKTGNLFDTIRCYNGSGSSTRDYANNVKIFSEYSREIG